MRYLCYFVTGPKEWLKSNFKFSLWEWLYNSIPPNKHQRQYRWQKYWNYIFVIPKLKIRETKKKKKHISKWKQSIFNSSIITWTVARTYPVACSRVRQRNFDCDIKEWLKYNFKYFCYRYCLWWLFGKMEL